MDALSTATTSNTEKMNSISSQIAKLREQEKILIQEREKLETTIIETPDTDEVKNFLGRCFNLSTVPKELISPLNKCLESGKIQDYCNFFVTCLYKEEYVLSTKLQERISALEFSDPIEKIDVDGECYIRVDGGYYELGDRLEDGKYEKITTKDDCDDTVEIGNTVEDGTIKTHECRCTTPGYQRNCASCNQFSDFWIEEHLS